MGKNDELKNTFFGIAIKEKKQHMQDKRKYDI